MHSKAHPKLMENRFQGALNKKDEKWNEKSHARVCEGARARGGGLLNKNAIIIYDRNNKPDFIKREYQPYLAKRIIKINSALGKDQNKKILSYL